VSAHKRAEACLIQGAKLTFLAARAYDDLYFSEWLETMCANFKPLTIAQLRQLSLPEIEFEYADEAYPNYELPLLFQSQQGLEWRKVHFGMIPKWADDKSIALKTYNARNETLMQKPSFANAVSKCKFGVMPAAEFYESKYIDNKPQRWGVRRKDGNAFYIAALYGPLLRAFRRMSLNAGMRPK